MTETAHTPGPWFVPDQTFARNLTVEVDDGVACPGSGGAMSYTTEICTLGWQGTPEWDANAHLIAAAPDFADNAPRAIEMLRVAAAFIREHDPDGNAHYDEAVCDGYCIADDCESAADTLQGALAKAKGGDA